MFVITEDEINENIDFELLFILVTKHRKLLVVTRITQNTKDTLVRKYLSVDLHQDSNRNHVWYKYCKL